jgi:hypothetical protein
MRYFIIPIYSGSLINLKRRDWAASNLQAYYTLSAGIMISSRYKIDAFSAEMFYIDEI